jgi:uncharacterized protein YegJ (DUF2314 family)
MFFFFLCALLFFSCDKSPVISAYNRPSTAIEIEQSDEEIARIAENARRALPIFFRNLARPEKGADNFCVKYPLTADDGGGIEQVWLGGIRFKDGVYYGSLANTTSHPDKKKGSTITFDPDAITDWMYIQDGKIIGGRSIKYLLEKIPEDKRGEDQRKILQMFD